MDQELEQRLSAQENKLNQIYLSVEKTRKYFLWTLIITVVTIVLPLVALAFVLPWFMDTMMNAYGL